MNKEKLVVLFFIFFICHSSAQQIVLNKGVIMEDVAIADSIPETISLYLPTNFENNATWPVVFLIDLKGRSKQSVAIFREAAEKEGYILAASDNLSDTLDIGDNVLRANRMINWVGQYLPIQNNRFYTAGFGVGGKMAATIATVVPKISGMIMMGSSLPNLEILYNKKNFQFIGVVGHRDYNLLDMQKSLKLLNSNKYPNQMLVFEGGHTWPTVEDMQWALRYLTLSAMAKGNATADGGIIRAWYNQEMELIDSLRSQSKLVRAYDRLSQAVHLYRLHLPTDSLEKAKKEFRKNRLYRNQRRMKNSIFFKETLIRDDYVYYLEEDVLTANFNNLGWWNYQMSQLEEYRKSKNPEEQDMAERLEGYLNALVADHIDIIREGKTVDLEALMFTLMLKTITAPQEYENYLEIISQSARVEDFGTAIFYLEELLKNGYTDRDRLYDLEHTALLRITPQFNQIIAKYIKDPRYDPGEQ